MSDLHKFLQDWLDAATGKIEKPAWYDDARGLCACAYHWDHARVGTRAYPELKHRIGEDFRDAYIYPFGGVNRFNRDIRDGTMHLNKERLEWVRKVLAETVWGAVIDIEVVRERPDWLKASDICDIKDRGVWTGGCGRFKASEWFWHKDVTQIKLLADHAYYSVQDYNKEHGTSYTYWGGQGDKPADWDGSDVVLRNGKTVPSPVSWSHPWGGHGDEEFDVIGYTRKADDLKDFLTEWLECATSDREGPLWFSRAFGLCYCAEMWDGSKGRNAREPLKGKLRADFPRFHLFPFGGNDRYLDDKHDEAAHQNPERLAWVRKTLGLTPPAEDTVAAGDTVDAYAALRGILDEAYNQSAKGARQRGATIYRNTTVTGIGFPTGQAIKKITEASVIFLIACPVGKPMPVTVVLR